MELIKLEAAARRQRRLRLPARRGVARQRQARRRHHRLRARARGEPEPRGRADGPRARLLRGRIVRPRRGGVPRARATANPPPIAQQTISRYLEAIQARKRQTTPGWSGYAELGLGYDDNITGVPTDFGAAAQQSFGIVGIEATGNSVKRKAAFANGLGRAGILASARARAGACSRAARRRGAATTASPTSIPCRERRARARR